MLLIAHRTPTTAQGCAELAAAGAGAFEVDVQLRGTDVVVSHFLPFLQLRGWLQHDGRRFRWRSGPPHDPLLSDVLSIVPASSIVLLDPKETAPARRERLADALGALPGDRTRLRVSTDVETDLQRYRAAGLTTWRTIKSGRDLDRMLGAGGMPDAGLSIRHTLLSAPTMARLRTVAGQIVAWTVNDVMRAAQLRDLGVDAITTDRLDVIRAVSAPP